MSTLSVSSTAFAPNQPIPRKYTADGHNVSPPLAWQAGPAGTVEYAVIVDDPDAPSPQPWVHWLCYRIPESIKNTPEGVPPSQRIANPPGALQGKNSWDRTGYGGPQPPKGHGTHHYRFAVYALDAALDVQPNTDKKTLLAAMQGHILAQGELVGTYER